MDNIDCGKRKLSRGRVWGGEEVERSSIPWQVAIFDHIHNEWQPVCGGTLISPYHVLTAGHCMGFPNDCWRYSVGIGMHHGNVSDGTRIRIHHISNHPSYQPKHCGLDIARFDFSVLHLTTPFTFNNEVQPACLPDSSMFYGFLIGKNLTVSGWGQGLISEVTSPVLRKATYPAVSNADCIKYDGNYKNCKVITFDMFCAGYPENRTASSGKGNSGGSIQCYL